MCISLAVEILISRRMARRFVCFACGNPEHGAFCFVHLLSWFTFYLCMEFWRIWASRWLTCLSVLSLVQVKKKQDSVRVFGIRTEGLAFDEPWEMGHDHGHENGGNGCCRRMTRQVNMYYDGIHMIKITRIDTTSVRTLELYTAS